MGEIMLVVFAAIAIIEAMAIVGLAAYYAGREAKVGPIIQEYERIKREEELRADPEGVRERPEKNA